MRRFAIAGMAATALTSGGVALANERTNAARRTIGHVQVIKVFAQTVQLKVTGVKLGDEVVFSDNLLTSKHGSVVGFDGGVCTVARVKDAATATGLLQCSITVSLTGGQIVSEGLFRATNGQFKGTQIVAITGGTGRFRAAGGQLAVEFFTNTEGNFTFSIAR
jgi:hypothetical protein